MVIQVIMEYFNSFLQYQLWCFFIANTFLSEETKLPVNVQLLETAYAMFEAWDNSLEDTGSFVDVS
jgi:hypothetical protein